MSAQTNVPPSNAAMLANMLNAMVRLQDDHDRELAVLSKQVQQLEAEASPSVAASPTAAAATAAAAATTLPDIMPPPDAAPVSTVTHGSPCECVANPVPAHFGPRLAALTQRVEEALRALRGGRESTAPSTPNTPNTPKPFQAPIRGAEGMEGDFMRVSVALNAPSSSSWGAASPSSSSLSPSPAASDDDSEAALEAPYPKANAVTTVVASAIIPESDAPRDGEGDASPREVGQANSEGVDDELGPGIKDKGGTGGIRDMEQEEEDEEESEEQLVLDGERDVDVTTLMEERAHFRKQWFLTIAISMKMGEVLNGRMCQLDVAQLWERLGHLHHSQWHSAIWAEADRHRSYMHGSPSSAPSTGSPFLRRLRDRIGKKPS